MYQNRNKISSYKFPNWIECLVTVNPLIWFPIERNMKSDCSLFGATSLLTGEKKHLTLFLSMPYVPSPVNQQCSGTLKSRIHLSGSRSESETVTTRNWKKLGSPRELIQKSSSQIAGHSILLVHAPDRLPPVAPFPGSVWEQEHPWWKPPFTPASLPLPFSSFLRHVKEALPFSWHSTGHDSALSS